MSDINIEAIETRITAATSDYRNSSAVEQAANYRQDVPTLTNERAGLVDLCDQAARYIREHTCHCCDYEALIVELEDAIK